MQNFKKLKILGVECYRIIDAEFDTVGGLGFDTFLLTVVWKALHMFPQPVERQPICPLRLLGRGQGGVELQLARQRLGSSQPRCFCRKFLHFSLVSTGEFCLL